MTEITLANGLSFQIGTIVEVDLYEVYGDGYKAKIWRSNGFENQYTDWTLQDQQEANRLGIKTTIKTD